MSLIHFTLGPLTRHMLLQCSQSIFFFFSANIPGSLSSRRKAATGSSCHRHEDASHSATLAININRVEAMLDKTICAMSDVFIGLVGSTFTEDILWLRKDWGSASLCDEYFIFCSPQPCFLDDEHVKKLTSLGVSMNKLETAWNEDVKKPKPRTKWVMQPGGPVYHKSMTFVEPSRLILLTAQRFIQTFLGENFIALHFRRQVLSLVVVNGKTVPLVRRPARNSDEKWDALLYRHGFEGDRQVTHSATEAGRFRRPF
ncbi:GDP-fucose protein O-fucosyltransferase [Datura stramonium]|uniref:GDP-fucose protein O-fucosyltransferase n=1 Tax=Datura stramonium TaxID=4076 RepID=A0ABS8V1R6_DATST|nr:GDP-fucose protein O-fucosyltransferase [Datura stramonium]